MKDEVITILAWLVYLLIFVLIIVILTFPIWGIVLFIKRKKKKEHERWRKEYYTKQLEAKQKIEAKGLERLKKTEELTKQKEKILEVDLAGLYYRPKKAHEIAGALNVGDSLELKRNPSNEYDEFAVKVMDNGVHIGFIPQTYSEEVSTEIKKGNGYRVFVSRTDKDYIPHIWIKLFPYESGNRVAYQFD